MIGFVILDLIISLVIAVGSVIYYPNVIISLIINIVVVVGVALFMGNSGRSSFEAYAGFVGLEAYVLSILTLPIGMKKFVLPNLPAWLSQGALPLLMAMLVSVMVVGAVSFVFG